MVSLDMKFRENTSLRNFVIPQKDEMIPRNFCNNIKFL